MSLCPDEKECVKECRDLQVRAALASQNFEIERLVEALKLLRVRLAPVLNARNEETKSSTPKPILCELAKTIETSTDIISDCADAVQSLVFGLEI